MDNTDQLQGIFWDAPNFLLNDKIFTPKIFDPPSLGATVPNGFNTICINLDGSLKSSLDWKEAIQAAQEYIKQGYLLFWNLNLGLFAELVHPLSNQTQFLSLGLSIEHFRDDIWKKYRNETLGVCLYKGNSDHLPSFQWDNQQLGNFQEWLKDRFRSLEILLEETGVSANSFHECSTASFDQSKEGSTVLSLFCRDAAAEYLQLLAARLPDGLEGFVSFDNSETLDNVLKVNTLNKERYAPLHIMTNGCIEQQAHKANIGICWPPLYLCRSSHYKGLNESLQILQSKNFTYRIIPEETLITDWDGLDYLIVSPTGLSPQGKRKLQGFCAAGGTVVSLDNKIGLTQEKTWLEWIREY